VRSGTHDAVSTVLEESMKRACIAIVDAAHARIYSYQQLDQRAPTLQEERSLANAGRQEHDKFSTTKPGNRWQEGGRGSTDDHRNNNVAMQEEKFAKVVVDEIVKLVREQGFPHVIVVASPKMLGQLRQADGVLRKMEIGFDEIAQDLAWLSSPQVHDHLAAMKLIEPRPRAPYTRNARTR